MNDENERSVASAGSVEPVAWAVVSDSTEQIDCEFVYPDETTAGDVALDSNGGVVPLYRQPSPTLTAAEREAVDMAIDSLHGVEDVSAGASSRADAAAATLRGLLERTK